MMKRFVFAWLFVAVTVPAFGQGTTMPHPLITWLGNSGELLTAGGLCVFRAGTSTLATTYTTAGLSVANANPVLFNSAARATSGGVFLTPGESYKFLLKDFTGVVSPTCIPDTGVTLFSVDNISAVPPSSVNVDVPGTAGESFVAGEVGYLSDGSGARTAGQWFKTDADLPYAGSLPSLAVAVTNIASGVSGSFRLTGRVTGLSALSVGADYYVSTTAGAITITSPVQSRLMGRADSATSLILTPNPRATPVKPRAPCGRLTLTTNVPVTTADVVGPTVYYAPYEGCSSITLYDGTASWYAVNVAQLSVAVPAPSNTAYDVFVYDNAGTATLELTTWTNLTTRATALVMQDGALVKTGATTRLYLGSFRSSASVASQAEDTAAKRYVWNNYNRVPRLLKLLTASASWPYTTSTWRQAEALATNQVDVFIGVIEDAVQVSLYGAANNATVPCAVSISIGLDSTTAPAANVTGGAGYVSVTSVPTWMSATWVGYPGLGHHTFVWLERSQATGATTWYGENQPSGFGEHHGLLGWVQG